MTNFIRRGLQSCATKVLMGVLYAARMAPYDLLHVVGGSASVVTKWTVECDRKLHRLMFYIDSMHAFRRSGWIGDPKCCSPFATRALTLPVVRKPFGQLLAFTSL